MCGGEISRVTNVIPALPKEPNDTSEEEEDVEVQPEEEQNEEQQDTETKEPEKKVEVVEEEKVGKGSFTIELVVSEEVGEAAVENFKVKNLKELLTKEEIKEMEDGATVKVYLEIVDINDTVEEEQKVLVENQVSKVVDEYVASAGLTSTEEVTTKVTYLDLSLFKQVGDKNAKKMDNTGKEAIAITIVIPDDMKSDNTNKTGEYSVIRVHGKEITVLQTTLNEADGTVTFETDQFSTYALVFTEKAEKADTEMNVDAESNVDTENMNDTKDSSWIIIVVILILAIGVVVLKSKKSKKDKS